MVATREDPPLPLARLRSQGKLGEIRADSLRFTLAEAELFLTRATSLALSEAQVETLEKRTEGWIAGLQMAALRCGERGQASRLLQEALSLGEPAGFVQTFVEVGERVAEVLPKMARGVGRH